MCTAKKHANKIKEKYYHRPGVWFLLSTKCDDTMVKPETKHYINSKCVCIFVIIEQGLQENECTLKSS